MIENRDEFIAFLIKAKNSTYAGGGAEVQPSRPKSKDLHFQQGKYQYIDSYLGGFRFIGEEAVWIDGQPEWGMNYYGWMLVDEIPEGFSECLKAALRAVPAEAPYRGPKKFTYGEYEYQCTWNGQLEQYTGEEAINYRGKRIYELVFHGGTIK